MFRKLTTVGALVFSLSLVLTSIAGCAATQPTEPPASPTTTAKPTAAALVMEEPASEGPSLGDTLVLQTT